jgi:hypothetical protein
MKVRFTSVGDEFLQPLFFTSQSLHLRVVFLTFRVKYRGLHRQAKSSPQNQRTYI